jgi:O-antigen/teichoic acid export membrane protein
MTLEPARTRDGLMEGANSISSGSTASLLSQVGGNAGLFVGVLIIARTLGPDGRGSVAFLTVLAQVAGYLAPFGASEGTFSFVARRPAARPRLLANLLLAATTGAVVVGAIVVGFLLTFSALRPGNIGTADVLALGLAIVTVALSQAAVQCMKGCRLFWEEAMVTATVAWLYPAALLTVSAVSQLTVTAAILAWAGTFAVSSLILFALMIYRFGIGRPGWDLLQETFHFGSRAWIGSLARFLNFRVDQIVVVFIGSAAMLGIYAVAVNCSELLLYLPGAVAWVIVPFVTRVDADNAVRRTLHVARGVIVVTFVSTAAAALVGPWLIPILFGAEFKASVVPFLLLLPGAFGFVFTAIFSSGLMAALLPGRSSLGALVSVPVGVALDFVLIPPFGASGAAAAASAALIASGITALVAYRSHHAFAWGSVVPRWDDVLDIFVSARRVVAR